MTIIAFGAVAVIGILAAILLVAFSATRGSSRTRIFAGSRPRLWHPVIRIACGVLAAAIMAAITVATWPATSPTVPDQEQTLFLVSRTAAGTAELPSDDQFANDDKNESSPVRLIYSVMPVSLEGDVLTPLDGKSIVINLPEDRRRQFVIEGTLPGGTFKAEISVDGIEHFDRDRRRVRGHHEVHYETVFGASGWHGTSLYGDGRVQVDRLTSHDGSAEHRPLSVVPDRVGSIAILSQLTECSDGQSREVSGSDWLAENDKNLRAAVNIGDFRATWRPQPQPNGIEMIRYVGPASALLLLAAILSSQVFRQRGMAFVAAMTVAVLFAVVMDRIMVERHAAWLANPQAAAGRSRVVSRMENSFFHAGRVKAILAKETR